MKNVHRSGYKITTIIGTPQIQRHKTLEIFFFHFYVIQFITWITFARVEIMKGFSPKTKKCGLLCLFSFWQKEIYSLNHFWWQKNRKNLTHPHFSLRIWASMPLWLGTSEKQRILTGVLKMSLLIKGICLQIAHGGCETGWRKKTMQCLLGKIHVLLNWR